MNYVTKNMQWLHINILQKHECKINIVLHTFKLLPFSEKHNV